MPPSSMDYYYYDYDNELQTPDPWGGMALALLLSLLTVLLLMLTGCKSVQYVPVVEHRTDTVQITKHQRDSIWLHDSIHVSESQRGDTIFVEVAKWHTQYIDRSTHDTTRVATHDTIPQPYPVEVEVERQLTWWQRTRMTAGTWALIAALLFIAYKSRNMVFAAVRWLANLRR